MGFLDATGLGTFWGKLKNYFVKKEDTEAPVTGLTDMLTPVNKWNNSSFTKNSSNISNPVILNTCTAGTTGNILIANGVYFSAWNLNLSNVSITRADNLLTVQCTLDSITSGKTYGCIMIESNNLKPITVKSSSISAGAELVSITDPGSNARLGVTTSGSVTVIYRNEAYTPGSFANLIYTGTTDASKRPALAFYLDTSHVNKTVSFSIRYPYAYEGEFKNPPYKESLDCSSSNPYLLADYSNVPYFDLFSMNASNTGFTAGYRRIMNLGGSTLSHTYYEWCLDAILSKAGHQTIGFVFDIKLRIFLDSNVTLQDIIDKPDYIKLYFHGFRQGTNTTFRINKLAVVTDGENLYLAVNCAYPIGGTLRLHPSTARILGRSSVTPWSSFIIYDNTVHSTDTVIKEVSVTDGF